MPMFRMGYLKEDPDPDPVRVGTTGTIGSLMLRELESIRRMEQKNSRGSDAVSISCGRPLASLAGYRLGMRKPSHRSNVEGSDLGRRSISDSNSSTRRGFEPPTSTCRMKRQESLPNQEHGRLQRKSVSLDGPMLSDADNDNDAHVTARPRRPQREKGGEFRTPMLKTEAEEGEGRRKSEEMNKCSLVEVVDLGCKGNNDRMWGSPIASRLRRLSFSRLSDSVNYG